MKDPRTDIDRLIEATLDDEDRKLRQALEDHAGFFPGALGMLSGPGSWARWIMLIAQGVMFVAGAILAWRFLQSEDTLGALKTGLSAGFLMLGALVIKIGMTPFMTEARLIAEFKRLELRFERLRAEGGGGKTP